MKIIGLLTAWVCEDWIDLAIKHIIELVDELIVSIGAYNKIYKKIADNTEQFALKYKDNPKIKFIGAVSNPINTRFENRCITLNNMLKVSENIKIGNIVWILDTDEFYSKAAINEIMNFIKNNDFDELRLAQRNFCINMKYFIKAYQLRFFKIKTKNVYFTPTQQFNPIPKSTTTLLEECPVFHYTLLTGEQHKGLRMISDHEYTNFAWYRRIYNHYDPENEEYWMMENKRITGVYGFYYRNDIIIEKNNHGLYRYKGKHPNIIENSHLIDIPDFRLYMKQKPNYKIYLSQIREMISKRNKIIYRIKRQFGRLLLRVPFLKNFLIREKIKGILKSIISLKK